MNRPGTRCIALALCLLCVAAPGTVRALDPLSLVLLRLLRDHVITAQLEAALAPRAEPAPPAPVARYAGDLKSIVDLGFPHLDAAQRSAVHERLAQLMNEAADQHERDMILGEFVKGATAARRAHQVLAGLTAAQKRAIASEAAAAYRGRDPQALAEAIILLRSSAIPIPADLRELMLAEFTAQSAPTLSR